MTNTTPAALSAQLEAANKRADTAHAEGKAEGLREAAGCIGHITRFEDLDAILALRAIAGEKP